MKERGIIMTGDSVRAIQDNRKTQTRRVITHIMGYKDFLTTDGDIVGAQEMLSHRPANSAFILPHCPYGQPGDRLYVRETWAVVNSLDEVSPSKIKYGDFAWPQVWYRATDNHTEDFRRDYFGRWRPSIHMPRWASRITLEVTGVRAERVQEISEADIIAEGIKPWADVGAGEDYMSAFRMLWDAINARRGYSWESNCWVWVIEFKCV